MVGNCKLLPILVTMKIAKIIFYKSVSLKNICICVCISSKTGLQFIWGILYLLGGTLAVNSSLGQSYWNAVTQVRHNY